LESENNLIQTKLADNGSQVLPHLLRLGSIDVEPFWGESVQPHPTISGREDVRFSGIVLPFEHEPHGRKRAQLLQGQAPVIKECY